MALSKPGGKAGGSGLKRPFVVPKQTKEPGLWQKFIAWRAVRKQGAKMRREAKEAARIQKIKDAASAKAEKTKVTPPVQVAEKGRVETRKPVGAVEREIPIEEMEKLNKMAKKAAMWPPFIEACKRNGLKPEDTFKHYYGILSGDEAVIDKKLDLMEEADRRHHAGEKIRFSETKFFADEIIERYLSKPKTQQ